MEKLLIKTPLRYPGGKTRVASMLVDCMPQFSEYREPFIGGGSVFIEAKQRNKRAKYWINDLFYDVYRFWEAAKSDNARLMEIVSSIKASDSDGKAIFRRLNAEILSLDGTDRAAAFFALNRMTFSGTTLSGGFSSNAFESRFTPSSVERIGKLEPLMTDVTVTNHDYSELLTAEGEDVFIFLDPPYYSATKSALYGRNGDIHRGFDHERFARTVRQCGHRWLITYDDCEYTRSLFKGYKITPFSITYGMRNVGKAESRVGEIMISNY